MLDPKHSPVPATKKKMDSVPVETRTAGQENFTKEENIGYLKE